MGAQESTEIQMSFNHPSLFYYAGEQVTDNISFVNTHDKLILEELFLEFIGELSYAMQETHHNLENLGNPQPEDYIDYHRIPFMSIRLSVVQPENGQHEIVLNHGQYSWPFEFILPEHLPPSLIPSTISYPYVKYYTCIVLDKPWYKLNAKHIYPLTIFPHVNLTHLPSAQQIVPFSYLNRKKVQLNGHLLRGGIAPRDNLPIYINLQNPKQCIIKRIEAILIQHHQVAQSHHEETIFRIDLPDIYEFDGTQLERIFNLSIPVLHLPPTYSFTAHFNYQTHPVIIKYEFVLKVKVHGMLTDFEVKMPIMIGTDQQQANNSTVAHIASAPRTGYEEPPPSYDAIVSNEIK